MRIGSGSRTLLQGGILAVCTSLLLGSLVSGLEAPALPSEWSVNERVNDDLPSSRQDRPDVAVDSTGNAYAIWRDLRFDPYLGASDVDVFFSYRPAGGDWSADERVNDDTGPDAQDWPAIVVDAVGNAAALWTDPGYGDDDIFAAYRPAGGHWSINERVDDGGTAEVDHPDLAMDPAGNLYALWQDWRNGDPDIYFSFRPAGGSWGPGERVSDALTGTIQYPGAIAVDSGGNAYAVWPDERNGNPDIYFSYRPAGGGWSANQRVNGDEGIAEQWTPAIAVDAAGNAHAVWQDNRHGNYDIYSADRPAGGSWGPDVRVDDDTGEADQLTVAIGLRGNNIMAVWQDERNGQPDIYASYRLAGGPWSANERLNDSCVNSRYYPAVDLDPTGAAYVVWSDERNGDADVYFSHRHGPHAVFLPIILATSPPPGHTAIQAPKSE